MLQNKLFVFNELLAEGNSVQTNVTLNPSHPIFEGHFPGQPVLPGVCMMQMVKELLEVYIKKQTRLLKAGDLKFLAVVVPQAGKLIRLELKINPVDKYVSVDARLLDNEAVFFKFKGSFEAIN